MRTDQFPTTLRRLIRGSTFKNPRQKISRHLGLSLSSLSHYENGKTSPKLSTLIRLSEFFNVSLDFLICGQEFQRASSDEATSKQTEQYADNALTRILAQTDRRSWLSGRLATHLQGFIDQAANELASEERLRSFPGLLDDHLTSILERYSHQTSIYNTYFDYSFIPNEGGGVPGKFFDVVATNLDEGKTYRYLLAPGYNWSREIEGFKKEIERSVGPEGNSRCEIFVANHNMLTGLGLYQLNTEALLQYEPIIWEIISEYVDGKGRFAYLIPPTTNIHGDLIFPVREIESVFRQFESMWAEVSKGS